MTVAFGWLCATACVLCGVIFQEGQRVILDRSLSEGCRFLAVVTADNRVSVYNVSTDMIIGSATYANQTGSLPRAAINASGNWLAVGNNGVVSVFTLRSPEVVANNCRMKYRIDIMRDITFVMFIDDSTLIIGSRKYEQNGVIIPRYPKDNIHVVRFGVSKYEYSSYSIPSDIVAGIKARKGLIYGLTDQAYTDEHGKYRFGQSAVCLIDIALGSVTEVARHKYVSENAIKLVGANEYIVTARVLVKGGSNSVINNDDTVNGHDYVTVSKKGEAVRRISLLEPKRHIIDLANSNEMIALLSDDGAINIYDCASGKLLDAIAAKLNRQKLVYDTIGQQFIVMGNGYERIKWTLKAK